MVKVRKGFVSNSSSASFVCRYCGESFVAMGGIDDGFPCPHCDHSYDKFPEDFVEFVMQEQGLIPEVWLRKFWRFKGERR